MSGSRWSAVDVASAAVLTFVAVGLTFSDEGGNADTLIDTLTVLAVPLPLLWRRRAPRAAALGIAVGMVVSGLPTFDQTRCAVSIPAGMLVVFAVASQHGWRWAGGAVAAWLAGFAVVCASDPVLEGEFAAPMALAGGLVAVAAASGVMAGIRQRLAAALRERTAALAERREQTAAMAVEAQSAQLDADLRTVASDRVREIIALAEEGADFSRIEVLARAALNDMRRMLDVLRSDESADMIGRPTLAQLDVLLRELRAAGRPVDLRMAGAPPADDDALEATAYRLIEHGLASVTEASAIDVRFEHRGVALEVRGVPAAGVGAAAALAAARERAGLRGGTVRVGSEGALRVFAAWLPVAT